MLKFLDIDGKRDHDLEMRIVTFLEQFGGGAEECTELNTGDLGIDDAETDTTETHHRVDLMKSVDTFLYLFEGDVETLGDFTHLLFTLGSELMQRGVHQTEGERFAVKHLEGCLSIFFDIGFESVEGGDTFFDRVAQNHVAQFLKRFLAVLAIEHMLDTEQTDTFGTEADSTECVIGVVGVGADTHGAEFIDEGHETLEQRVLGSVNHLDIFLVDPSLGAVEGEEVSFFELVAFDGDNTILHVNLDGITSNDAAFAPSTGNKSGMAGHTTTSGKNTVGGTHTFDIFRIGLLTHEDVADASGGIFLGLLRGEGDNSDSSSRTCGKTLGDNLMFFLVGAIEDRMQEFVEL